MLVAPRRYRAGLDLHQDGLHHVRWGRYLFRARQTLADSHQETLRGPSDEDASLATSWTRMSIAADASESFRRNRSEATRRGNDRTVPEAPLEETYCPLKTNADAVEEETDCRRRQSADAVEERCCGCHRDDHQIACRGRSPRQG